MKFTEAAMKLITAHPVCGTVVCLGTLGLLGWLGNKAINTGSDLLKSGVGFSFKTTKFEMGLERGLHRSDVAQKLGSSIVRNMGFTLFRLSE